VATLLKTVLLAVIAAALAADAAAAADDELIATVIVSRHGVRSPIAARTPLAAIAADPWPAWPVPPGDLTPRGAELARLLGVYYRDHYVAQGLFPRRAARSRATCSRGPMSTSARG
jgi:4-phytase/acid phosphatase